MQRCYCSSQPCCWLAPVVAAQHTAHSLYTFVLSLASLLRAVSVDNGAARAPRRAVWFNMREEPQIFINGRPYVLRDELRPFKNMREYTSITASTLEKMEERFREDVVREAELNGGRVPVCKEGSGPTLGELEMLWEVRVGGAGDEGEETAAGLSAVT